MSRFLFRLESTLLCPFLKNAAFWSCIGFGIGRRAPDRVRAICFSHWGSSDVHEHVIDGLGAVLILVIISDNVTGDVRKE